MRKLHLISGGRPRSLDDLYVLQTLAQYSGLALLKGKGAFIVSGCEVSGLDIAPGFVMIDDMLIQFPGATVDSFPCYMNSGSEITDTEQLYEDGETKPTQALRTPSIVYSPSEGQYITFSSTGGRTYFDAIADNVVLTKGSQSIQGVKNFASKIVSAGMSIVDEIAAIKGPGWVTTARIADGAVTNAKLAENAVGYSQLQSEVVITGKIGPEAVTNSKLAPGAVTSSKIANFQVGSDHIAPDAVTLSKLSPAVLAKFAGSQVRSSSSVDFRGTSAALSSKTYSYLSTVLNRADVCRLYVKLAFYATRDSGDGDNIQVFLQRSTSPSFTSPVTVATRYFRMDGNTQVYCPVEIVDTNASADGTYYYRLVCSSVSGTANYYSNSYESISYAVPYAI